MSGHITIFTCDPWESYMRELAIQSDREWLAREQAEDLDAEEQLGRMALLDAEEDGCDPDAYLPEYAPRPYDVQLPEVFEL